jgi:hypothetical protein
LFVIDLDSGYVKPKPGTDHLFIIEADLFEILVPAILKVVEVNGVVHVTVRIALVGADVEAAHMFHARSIRRRAQSFNEVQ